MDSFEVRQVINELSIEVRNFRRSRDGKSWTWSCEVCGDSRINKRKARFGVAIKDGSFVCHCFNCGYSASFIHYLKDFHPHQYERVVVSGFMEHNPLMNDIDRLFNGQVSDKSLLSLFYINNFSNTKYWLDYLEKKKIKLKKENIRKLYNMHKEYWNETHSMVRR